MIYLPNKNILYTNTYYITYFDSGLFKQFTAQFGMFLSQTEICNGLHSSTGGRVLDIIFRS